MLNPDFRDMLSVCIAEEVEFLVVGAYALAAHGLPRATGDLDCWIRRSAQNAARTLRALERFGAPLEQVTEADLMTPDTVLQIGVEPNRIDILTSIDGVEFDDAWPRRTEAEVSGIRVPLLGLAELVSNKRASGRPQDLADVARIEAELGRQA